MVELLASYFSAVWGLFLESAPYLLFGFACAGVLKVLIPAQRVQSWIGGDDFRSVVRASLLGVPMPLCSCSVLPTAAALRRSGASKGATTSFLISTPETGIDSMSISWVLLGPVMALARPVAALVSALFGGALVNALVHRGADGQADSDPADADPVDQANPDSVGPSCHPSPAVDAESAESAAADPSRPGPGGAAVTATASGGGGWVLRLLGGLRWSYGKLLDDLTPWLVVGFLLSGLITLFLPEDFFGGVVPRGIWSALMMLVLGTPMYICATASTPMAVAMMAKGLDPGAALVFLLVGPATNATTIFVLQKILGGRLVLAYVASVAGMALVSGAVLNQFFDVPVPVLTSAVEGASASSLSFFGALILLALMMASALRIGLWGRSLKRLGQLAQWLGLPPRATGVAVLLALVAGWATTAATRLEPGEQAWVLRFGRIESELTQTGLHWHLPWPFEQVERLRPWNVRRVEIGFRSDSEGRAENDSAVPNEAALLDEAEVLTGDENLLTMSLSVHYSIRDASRWRYGIQEPDRLVRGLAESMLRRIVARHTADRVLVELREELGARVEQALQQELDRVDAGLQVLHISVFDVHASGTAAHYEFRDVASALEDRERMVHEAQRDVIESLAEARSEAARIRVDARVSALEDVAVAQGTATSFRARAEAFRSFEAASRLRLRMDALRASLKDAAAVFLLGEGIEVEAWTSRTSGGANTSFPPLSTGGASSSFRDPWVESRERENRR